VFFDNVNLYRRITELGEEKLKVRYENQKLFLRSVFYDFLKSKGIF